MIRKRSAGDHAKVRYGQRRGRRLREPEGKHAKPKNLSFLGEFSAVLAVQLGM